MAKVVTEQRMGKPPVVGEQPPQLQFSDKSPRNIFSDLCKWMFDPNTFTMAEEKTTRISVRSSRALFLKEDTPVAHPDAFMPPQGGREFAHLHEDGSCHLVVGTELEDVIIAKGWGLHHPYHSRGVKEVLVYAPRDEAELELLKKLVQESYYYASGNPCQ